MALKVKGSERRERTPRVLSLPPYSCHFSTLSNGSRRQHDLILTFTCQTLSTSTGTFDFLSIHLFLDSCPFHPSSSSLYFLPLPLQETESPQIQSHFCVTVTVTIPFHFISVHLSSYNSLGFSSFLPSITPRIFRHLILLQKQGK